MRHRRLSQTSTDRTGDSWPLALPFELKTPIVSLGPIVITNVEVILYALIVLWIVRRAAPRRIHWTLAHSAVLAWLIVQFLAAIFAPIEREAAIKFALRSAGGALLFFIAADWTRSSRRVACDHVGGRDRRGVVGIAPVGLRLNPAPRRVRYSSSRRKRRWWAARCALAARFSTPTPRPCTGKPRCRS